MNESWAEFRRRIAEIEALAGAAGILEWDQQTYMPPGGAAHRGQQLATLSGISHARLVDLELGRIIEAVREVGEAEGDPVKIAAARMIGRRHERARRIPERLVREQAEAASEGFQAWMKAREERAFAPFLPALERLVRVTREIVACHAAAEEAGHPYDHLLAEFDPGSTTDELTPMFDRLAGELGALIEAIDGREGPAPLAVTVPRDRLAALNDRVARALGFRMEDGRIDEAQHPFTMGVGPHDVRLTTHLYEDDLLGTLGGTIHETGHGLYEQGIPDELAGTGLGTAAGLGLHESQSRFWENAIGRSLPFMRWLAPVIEEVTGQRIAPETLYGAANRVRPTLIRVMADEVTYNLHIIVRFKLETALVAGELEAADLPGAWDELYERIVRVRPADPVEGVLQDVHWSSGMFGYFPSYTIGNLYAAGFRKAMEADLPDLWEQVEAGRFEAILGWLRERVHRRGHMVDAPEIFRDAAGDRDPVADLVDTLWERQGRLYGVERG